jgi:DNA processing protein
MTGPSPERALPDEAYAAALCALPGLGPRTLRQLLDEDAPPDAWAAVRSGHRLDVPGMWRPAARATDVAGLWATLADQGVGVALRGGAGSPGPLNDDAQAPAVLFHRGAPTIADRFPRVGIVGTRSATRYGLGVAAQLGAELAAAGVVVVSGLALGVDGAAHEGALAGWAAGRPGSAPPLAVVAGGLDRVYPARHARLWREVADAGAIVGETPLGGAVARWRFPQRNRILAALCEVLIVVECHPKGGSLHTVRAASSRGIAVGAVPGSIRSPASAGTNDLLADGCFPVRDAADVLVALDLARAGSEPIRPRRSRTGRGRPATGPDPLPTFVGPPEPERWAALGPTQGTPEDPGEPPGSPGSADADPARETSAGPQRLEEAILEALGWERCSMEQILRRTGESLSALSLPLERLRDAGRVVTDGARWERC